MNEHIKRTLLKVLFFIILIAVWTYTTNGHDIKGAVLQSVGSGLLFGIIIYFFDPQAKKAGK